MKHLVIIPAFNEEANLERTLSDLAALPDQYEFLVIDDGSHDSTGEIAARLASLSGGRIRALHFSLNCGIGTAIQAGYMFAAQCGIYEYVLRFDADGQHDVGAVLKLVEESRRRKLDLCVGSRFLESSESGFRTTLLRRLGIIFLSRMISLLSGVRVTDPASGLQCASPRAWRHFARRHRHWASAATHHRPVSAIRQRLAAGPI